MKLTAGQKINYVPPLHDKHGWSPNESRPGVIVEVKGPGLALVDHSDGEEKKDREGNVTQAKAGHHVALAQFDDSATPAPNTFHFPKEAAPEKAAPEIPHEVAA